MVNCIFSKNLTDTDGSLLISNIFNVHGWVRGMLTLGTSDAGGRIRWPHRTAGIFFSLFNEKKDPYFS